MKKKPKIYPEIVLEPETFEGKLDFEKIFGRNAPVHIEIGSGKGTFLVSEARAYPEHNYLGIEWARKFYLHAVDRMGRWGIENVRLIRTEAREFIAEHVPEEAVDCFHIYYPDPWPKKRHHKRRFIQKKNFEMLLGCLKPNGRIQIATDHENYFEQISAVVSEMQDKIEVVEFQRAAGAKEGETVGTNFERKYVKENRSVFSVAVLKK